MRTLYNGPLIMPALPFPTFLLFFGRCMKGFFFCLFCCCSAFLICFFFLVVLCFAPKALYEKI